MEKPVGRNSLCNKGSESTSEVEPGSQAAGAGGAGQELISGEHRKFLSWCESEGAESVRIKLSYLVTPLCRNFGMCV